MVGGGNGVCHLSVSYADSSPQGEPCGACCRAGCPHPAVIGEWWAEDGLPVQTVAVRVSGRRAEGSPPYEMVWEAKKGI